MIELIFNHWPFGYTIALDEWGKKWWNEPTEDCLAKSRKVAAIAFTILALIPILILDCAMMAIQASCHYGAMFLVNGCFCIYKTCGGR